MTYSILARDPETGAFGGAAATGSLCVGGWVLRGRAGVGISASQGASPSTLWGEEALVRLGRQRTCHGHSAHGHGCGARFPAVVGAGSR